MNKKDTPHNYKNILTYIYHNPTVESGGFRALRLTRNHQKVFVATL